MSDDSDDVTGCFGCLLMTALTLLLLPFAFKVGLAYAQWVMQ